jgi:ribosomal protein S11|uniref:Ribosomal protein S11 n=1 Tax=Thalassiosira pseudonana TaxID=35128 RepID=Q3S289_THAPS|nr:ribosomal protein S11 [Thalassiosira pseudonana]AAZ99415.1 ribosomal protein S11 [Thalassiosira pseudonana]QWM92935.1 ribosomal protein S11 [Thalassiosira pseudonana]
MLLLKIANKSLFSPNLITQNYIQCLFHKIQILKFIKKETFSFYLGWLLVFLFTKFQTIKAKTNYFISYIYFSFINRQKLISYVININLSPTNTFINVNNIKGNPKLFYSAGMFNLQKKQKIKQPKAIITILRALLIKSKIFKTKPVALHFNNLFFNHQSYIFKRLKQKTFIKLMTSYNYQPHNGCRLKKKKRIKIRTRTKKL